MNRTLLAVTTLLALGAGTAFAQAKGQGAVENPEKFFDGNGRGANPAMEADAASAGLAPLPYPDHKPDVQLSAAANPVTPAPSRADNSGKIFGWSLGIGAGAGAIAGASIGAATVGAGASAASMAGALAGGAALGALGGLAVGFFVALIIAAVSGNIG